ncbi:MAG: hypothetical protein Q7R52_03000 [archaeon]|nr:hypothetical protein [archaeon]
MGLIKNAFYAGVGAVVALLFFNKKQTKGVPHIPQPNVIITSIQQEPAPAVNSFSVTIKNSQQGNNAVKTNEGFWYVTDNKLGITLYEHSGIVLQPNDEIVFKGVILENQLEGSYTFYSGHSQCIDYVEDYPPRN